MRQTHPNASILFSGSRKCVDSSCATLIGAETMKATQIRPLHAATALFSLAHLNYTDTRMSLAQKRTAASVTPFLSAVEIRFSLTSAVTPTQSPSFLEQAGLPALHDSVWAFSPLVPSLAFHFRMALQSVHITYERNTPSTITLENLGQTSLLPLHDEKDTRSLLAAISLLI